METNIGQDIFDSQNALGQAIVDAQNANGQAITDARNVISGQHTQIIKMIHDGLPLKICQVYQATGGVCATFIGPLEEDETHVPLEMHWPEGQLSLVEKLNDASTNMDVVEEKIGKKVDAVEGKIDAVEGKINMLEGKISEKISTKMDVVEEKIGKEINGVEGKIDAVEGKVTAVEAMMMHLVEQNMKLMQLMEHK